MSHIELNNGVKQRRPDGFFDLEKDKEAIKVYQEEVDDKTVKFQSERDRLQYLLDERLYYDFTGDYDWEFVLDLTDQAYEYNFEFQSYMAISKFYKDYSLHSLDQKNYLENYEQHVIIVALYLGRGDKKQATRYMRAMMEQRYQPATPTFLNAGRARRGELISCYLLEVDDSLNSINYIDNTAKQLSKVGGGVAINLSKIRERGSSIKGIENVTKGVVPVAKMLEYSFDYADQAG